MSSIFSGTEVPSWLQESTKPADIGATGQALGMGIAGGWLALAEGKSAGEGVAEARMNQQDPMWRLKQEQTQATIKGHLAQAESEYALEKGRNAETSAWMQDVPVIAPWTSLAPEQRVGRSAPIVNSKTAFGILQKQSASDEHYLITKQNAENQSTSAKISVKDSMDFINQLGKLKDRASAAGIKGMSPNQDGSPSKMQLDAIGFAQQAEQQAAVNERTAAQMASDSRGDVVTTTITGDKITEKRTPPKPATSANAVMPVEKNMGGVDYIVNPKSGRFERKDKTGAVHDITVKDLLTQFRSAKTSGDPDQMKWIQNYAAEHFPTQSGLFGVKPAPRVASTKPVATNPSDVPKSFVDYLKANPESAESFDKKFGKGAAAKILQQ